MLYVIGRLCCVYAMRYGIQLVPCDDISVLFDGALLDIVMRPR